MHIDQLINEGVPAGELHTADLVERPKYEIVSDGSFVLACWQRFEVAVCLEIATLPHLVFKVDGSPLRQCAVKYDRCVYFF